MFKTGEQFVRLIEIIMRLRAQGGCPWDIRQTPESFKTYIIEEAYELLEAIDQNKPDEICEELGDLLFQVVFLNNLYAEKGIFSMSDVIRGISKKMIRRHPHVFEDAKISTEEELRQKWQEIKASENGKNSQPGSLFSSIPKALPALRRAQRVSERAARTGFDWPDINGAFEKLEEEIAELREALSGGDQEKINDELGDALLALVTVGRMGRANAEDALSAATGKFITRFTELEKHLAEQEKTAIDCDTKELLALWNDTKNHLT